MENSVRRNVFACAPESSCHTTAAHEMRSSPVPHGSVRRNAAVRTAAYCSKAIRHSMDRSSSADASLDAILPLIQAWTGINKSGFAHGPARKMARVSGLCASTKCLASTVTRVEADRWSHTPRIAGTAGNAVKSYSMPWINMRPLQNPRSSFSRSHASAKALPVVSQTCPDTFCFGCSFASGFCRCTRCECPLNLSVPTSA